MKEISFIKNRRHLTYALYITCIKSLVIFSRSLLRYIFIIFVFFVFCVSLSLFKNSLLKKKRPCAHRITFKEIKLDVGVP